MIDTNLYWNVRGTYIDRKQKLASLSKEYLEACILDAQYNDFLRKRSDYKEKDTHGHGKRLPYIGWYWRHLEFSDGKLPIGNCGQFIGFMANNKWDYPERQTTSEEFDRIMEIIDEAMRLDQEGGEVGEIINKVNSKLDELGSYLQTLTV